MFFAIKTDKNLTNIQNTCNPGVTPWPSLTVCICLLSEVLWSRSWQWAKNYCTAYAVDNANQNLDASSCGFAGIGLEAYTTIPLTSSGWISVYCVLSLLAFFHCGHIWPLLNVQSVYWKMILIDAGMQAVALHGPTIQMTIYACEFLSGLHQQCSMVWLWTNDGKSGNLEIQLIEWEDVKAAKLASSSAGTRILTCK